MSAAELPARAHPDGPVARKFRVHGLFRIPDLREVNGITAVDDLDVLELESTYYDTADLRLTREGITLRHRSGADDGWQLTLSTIGTTRADAARTSAARTSVDGASEPSAGTGDGPPAGLVDIVRVIVRGADVGPVATLRTARRRRLLRGNHDREVAELVDDTVHVLEPDGSVAARFRELELDEHDGGKALGRVADALAAAGAVGGEFEALVVRALGPGATAPPEVPEAPAAHPKEPAAHCVAAHLATQVRALRRHDVAFRHDPVVAGDPVHELRVAARRLRSGLRVFRPLLEEEWSGPLRAELRWFAHGLSALRETDVLRERVPDEQVLAATRQRLDDTRADVRALLSSQRYTELHDTLVQAVRQPRFTGLAETPARDVLPTLVRKAWKRLAHAASTLTPDAPDEAWHAARLAAKRARYAAEAVAPVLGNDVADFAAQLKKLTDVLGEHQDAVDAETALRGLAAADSCTTDEAFSLGLLAAGERLAARRARERFAKVWPETRRSTWRRWM